MPWFLTWNDLKKVTIVCSATIKTMYFYVGAWYLGQPASMFWPLSLTFGARISCLTAFEGRVVFRINSTNWAFGFIQITLGAFYYCRIFTPEVERWCKVRAVSGGEQWQVPDNPSVLQMCVCRFHLNMKKIDVPETKLNYANIGCP